MAVMAAAGTLMHLYRKSAVQEAGHAFTQQGPRPHLDVSSDVNDVQAAALTGHLQVSPGTYVSMQVSKSTSLTRGKCGLG